MNYEGQVERGVMYLDLHYPGWEKNVDLNTLDLSIGTICILAQATGSTYWTKIQEIAPHSNFEEREEWSCDRGFNVPESITMFSEQDEHEILTEAWKRAIRQRRVESPSYSPTLEGDESVIVEGTVTVGGKVINLPPVTLDYLLKLVEVNR